MSDSNSLPQELINYLENFKKSITENSNTELSTSLRNEIAAVVRTEVTDTLRTELATSIRAEVTAAVAPLRDTQKDIINELESTKNKVSEIVIDNADTKSKVQELQNQMLTFQQTMTNPATITTNPAMSNLPPSFLSVAVNPSPASSVPGNAGPAQLHPPSQADALSVLQNAKNILGFSPITIDDISYLKAKQSISDDSEAMIHSIIEFLNDEMKIPKHITDNILIKRVFTPAKQPTGWKTLYAEFQNSSSTNLINQYVTNLLPGKTVSIYVPHSLFPRFSAIRDLEHSYRNGDIRHKTRIKYGTSDFVLLVKPRNSNAPWSYVSLASLPPLQLSSFDGNLSSSPPPGRTRLSSKRSRESPDSGPNRNNKTRIDDIDSATDSNAENSVVNPSENHEASQETTAVVVPGAIAHVQTDAGAFHPSACVSPSVAQNKSFTFSAKPSIQKPNLNL